MNDFFLGLLTGFAILSIPLAYLTLREVAYLRIQRFIKNKLKEPDPVVVVDSETADLINVAEKLLEIKKE